MNELGSVIESSITSVYNYNINQCEVILKVLVDVKIKIKARSD